MAPPSLKILTSCLICTFNLKIMIQSPDIWSMSLVIFRQKANISILTVSVLLLWRWTSIVWPILIFVCQMLKLNRAHLSTDLRCHHRWCIQHNRIFTGEWYSSTSWRSLHLLLRRPQRSVRTASQRYILMPLSAHTVHQTLRTQNSSFSGCSSHSIYAYKRSFIRWIIFSHHSHLTKLLFFRSIPFPNTFDAVLSGTSPKQPFPLNHPQ